MNTIQIAKGEKVDSVALTFTKDTVTKTYTYIKMGSANVITPTGVITLPPLGQFLVVDGSASPITPDTQLSFTTLHAGIVEQDMEGGAAFDHSGNIWTAYK